MGVITRGLRLILGWNHKFLDYEIETTTQPAIHYRLAQLES